MLKMWRCRLFLLVSLLVFCSVPKCFAQEGGPRWLVQPELLASEKLEILWQNELPLKEGESLRDLHILGGCIYGLSDRNYMVSLNREDGNVIFSRAVAPVGFPVIGLELYKGGLFSVIGNRLVEINPESGVERSGRRLSVNAVCPAARNSSYFYVAGSDRRVHTLRAEDKVQAFEVAAENDSEIVSIVADEDFFVFATGAGNVISIAPSEPKRLWQFDVAGGIVGPIVRDGNSLFFASKDTNVYKLDIFRGKFVWKYQSGAVLERSPRATRGVVYQYAGDKGLAAIDKESGELLWALPEGVDLLAEADGKAYVITNGGKMVVMDNKKAKRQYCVNFAGVSKYATNVADSKIYIADEAGRIACLRPVE